MRSICAIAPLLLLASAPAFAQVQDPTFSNPVDVTSTTPVAVESITVGGAGSRDVALTAHVYAEATGADGGRYDFGICSGSASGPEVGAVLWRPGDRTPGRSSYESDAVTITGFEGGVPGPRTYVLCARKFDSTAPDLTLYPRGLNAVAAPAGTTLAGTVVTDFSQNLVIDSTSAVAVASVVVEASGSDVLLTAHARFEGAGLGGGGYYAVDLRRGGAAGPSVGHAVWRPPYAASAYQGDAVALTGFDANVSGTTTYTLTAAKVTAGAPNITVSQRGLHAVTAPAGTTLAGSQQTSASPSAPLGLTPTAIASVTADGGPTVRLTGHAYLEGSQLGAKRYTLGICRGDAAGPRVGYTYWRPNTQSTDASYVGDTVTVTGYDTDVSGPTTYVLCAGVFDSGAPAVSAYQRGIVVQAPEPDARLALAAAAAACAALRRWRAARS